MMQDAARLDELLRGVRAGQGLTRADVVEDLRAATGNASYSAQTLYRYEQPPWSRWHRVPSRAALDDLSKALDVPLETLRQAARASRAARRAARMTGVADCGPSGPPGSLLPEADMSSDCAALALSRTLEEVFDQWGDPMRRRDFLADSGAVAVGSLLPALTVPATTVLTPEVCQAHMELRRAYGKLDNLCGPMAVYAQAQVQQRQLIACHRAAHSAAERRRVAVMTANSTAFVGWLSYDLGLYQEAAQHYRHAAELAADAGDVSQCANDLGQLSRAFSERGAHQEALALTDAAVRVAGTVAHPMVRSWLHAIRAHHHALVDDERSCQNDLGAAEALFAKANDGAVPAYVAYHDEAEIAKWTGRALVRLGVTKSLTLRQGVEAADKAQRSWPAAYVRGSAEVDAACALGRAAQGEVEEAARLIRRAHTTATATGSARNLAAARQARAALNPYRDTQAVRDLDAYLLTDTR